MPPMGADPLTNDQQADAPQPDNGTHASCPIQRDIRRKRGGMAKLIGTIGGLRPTLLSQISQHEGSRLLAGLSCSRRYEMKESSSVELHRTDDHAIIHNRTHRLENSHSRAQFGYQGYGAYGAVRPN